MKIGIINYGMGNIQSVYNAFKYLKAEVEIMLLFYPVLGVSRKQ
jgi:imidazoleglycerol phosphate synthase glutamine amidotransferase subunit HisH